MAQRRCSDSLALAVLMAVLAVVPLGARAEDWDKQSYWFGFLMGSGTTVCELLKGGLLTQNDARDWLKTLLKPDPDIPAISLQTARTTLLEGQPGCPVPQR